MRTLRFRDGDDRLELTVRGESDEPTFQMGDQQWSARILSREDSGLLLEIDGRRHRVWYARRGNELFLHLDGSTVHWHRLDEDDEDAQASNVTTPVVQSPMPGKVIEVLVEPGQAVVQGQPVLRVEAMKMEVELGATVEGTIAAIHTAKGALVEPDAPLITIKPADEPSASDPEGSVPPDVSAPS